MLHVRCIRFPSDGRAGGHELNRHLRCIWRGSGISMPTTRSSSSGAPLHTAQESTVTRRQRGAAEPPSESSPREGPMRGSMSCAPLHASQEPVTKRQRTFGTILATTNNNSSHRYVTRKFSLGARMHAAQESMHRRRRSAPAAPMTKANESPQQDCASMLGRTGTITSTRSGRRRASKGDLPRISEPSPKRPRGNPAVCGKRVHGETD